MATGNHRAWCWLGLALALSLPAVAFDIEGTVEDETGAPVAGATVWIAQGARVQQCGSDASGRVSFSNVDVGSLAVIGRKPGRAMGGFAVMAAGPDSFTLTLGEPDEATLRVVDPLQFEGGGYKRIAGARVEQIIVNARFSIPVSLLVPHGFPALRSSDEGLLTIPCLPHGGHVALRVSHRAYADAFMPFILVGADAEFVVQLPPGVPVRGRVTGPDGAAVPGAVVCVFRTGERGMDTYKEVVTGSDGFYKGMAPYGEYLVNAACPGFVPPEPVPITVAAETTEVLVDLRLAQAGCVTGRVTDPDGQPVGAVPVGSFRDGVFFAETVTAAGTGEFHVEAPEGLVQVRLAAPDGHRADRPEGIGVTVAAGGVVTLEAPLVVVPLRAYSGRVLNPDGSPASETLVTVTDLEIPCRALTDDTGAFSLELVQAPSGATLNLSAEHGRRFLRATAQVPLAQTESIVLRLAPFEPDLRPDRSGEEDGPLEALRGEAAPALRCVEWVNVGVGDEPPALDQSLRGKVVVLTFWDRSDAAGIAARWIDEVNGFYDVCQGLEDVAFVGIASGVTDRSALAELTESFGVAWPVGRDPEGVPTFDTYDINYVPQTFLIDKGGIVRYYDVSGRLLELIKALRREA